MPAADVDGGLGTIGGRTAQSRPTQVTFGAQPEVVVVATQQPHFAIEARVRGIATLAFTLLAAAEEQQGSEKARKTVGAEGLEQAAAT